MPCDHACELVSTNWNNSSSTKNSMMMAVIWIWGISRSIRALFWQSQFKWGISLIILYLSFTISHILSSCLCFVLFEMPTMYYSGKMSEHAKNSVGKYQLVHAMLCFGVTVVVDYLEQELHKRSQFLWIKEKCIQQGCFQKEHTKVYF